MGRYIDALPLYECALAVSEAKLGATTLSNLAGVYLQILSAVEVLRLFLRALAIRLDEPDLDVAASLNSYACVLVVIGKQSDALPLFNHALLIHENNRINPDHLDVVAILSNLAGPFESMEMFTDSLPLYKQALSIFEKS